MNYMRYREAAPQNVVFFKGDPLPNILLVDDAPERWALHHAVPGMDQRFHIIGEDSDLYMLRQLATRGPEHMRAVWAKTLKSWLVREGTKDRVSVRAAWSAFCSEALGA